MRTALDFAPLFRSSVGFDRVVDLLHNAMRTGTAGNWPPYDIRKLGDDEYTVCMAVAGFQPDELSITFEPNLLVVRGNPAAESDAQYVYRGIEAGTFEHRFELADYVKVAQASLQDGLLTIELVREMPDELRPRRIPIGTGGVASTGSSPIPQIEDQKKAA